jgi:hypothetical protein
VRPGAAARGRGRAWDVYLTLHDRRFCCLVMLDRLWAKLFHRVLSLLCGRDELVCESGYRRINKPTAWLGVGLLNCAYNLYPQ